MLALAGCAQEPASEQAPTSSSTQTLRTAQRFIDAGQFDEAQAILVAARASWPDDPGVDEQLARVEFGRGLALHAAGLIEDGDAKLEAALDHWTSACAGMPSNAAIRVSAGDVAAMIGRTGEARAFYTRALELDQFAARAALCLAQLEMDQDPHQALALLEQAVGYGGPIPEAFASEAIVHVMLGDEPRARAAMDRAIEVGADLPAVRVMQARMERLLGHPARGVEVLSALGAQACSQPGTAWESAACWAAVDRWDKAAEAWETCFLANAHRTDAGDLAAEAARAWSRAGDDLQADSWWRQARLLGVPQDAPSSSP